MQIILQRLKDNGTSTIGRYTFPEIFSPYSIEDTGRDINHDGDLLDPGEVKVWGKTRIPCGEYEIKLREFGGMHEKYKKRFPWHRGMLWLPDVKTHKDIYLHIMNSANDSLGCLGIGMNKRNDDYILYSTMAYEKAYKMIIAAMDSGEKVTIKIIDEK